MLGPCRRFLSNPQRDKVQYAMLLLGLVALYRLIRRASMRFALPALAAILNVGMYLSYESAHWMPASRLLLPASVPVYILLTAGLERGPPTWPKQRGEARIAEAVA